MLEFTKGYAVYDGIIYCQKDCGDIEVTGYDDMADFNKVIVLEGTTGIRDDSFTGCDKIETIIIPQSVKSIGNGAFIECRNLKSVTIPHDIKSK